MRWAPFLQGIALLTLAVLFGGAAEAADYVVTVNCSQVKQHPKFMQGFLHGFDLADSVDPNLVGTNLKPAFWRLGQDGWDRYDRVAAFHPSICMVIGDLCADVKKGYTNCKPWLDWADWEVFCADHVRRSIDRKKLIDYWDIWGEPDTSGMWTGAWPQLLETYQRAYKAIKSVDPNTTTLLALRKLHLKSFV